MTNTSQQPTQIEPRRTTSEPLVEIDENGVYVPAGRRNSGNAERADGRNSYGLLADENVAFWAAVARLNKDKPDTEVVDGVTVSVHKNEYEFLTKAEHRWTADIDDNEARAEAAREYRAEYPLPERFTDLEPNDPASNFATPAPVEGEASISDVAAIDGALVSEDASAGTSASATAGTGAAESTR